MIANVWTSAATFHLSLLDKEVDFAIIASEQRSGSPGLPCLS